MISFNPSCSVAQNYSQPNFKGTKKVYNPEPKKEMSKTAKFILGVAGAAVAIYAGKKLYNNPAIKNKIKSLMGGAKPVSKPEYYGTQAVQNIANAQKAEKANTIVNYVEGLKKCEKGIVHNNRQKMYEKLFAEV